MKKPGLIFFISFVLTHASIAAVFEVDTIQYKGDLKKHINLVVMGDGYTLAEQTQFMTDAHKLTDYLFNIAPWSFYKNYFNVFAIKVISPESGVKHPRTAPDCGSQPAA